MLSYTFLKASLFSFFLTFGFEENGMISSKITNKIADAYGFPRPKPGDVVVGVGYFKDTIINSKMEEKQPYAFSMVVSAIGDRVQVPPDVIDSLYIEVILVSYNY